MARMKRFYCWASAQTPRILAHFGHAHSLRVGSDAGIGAIR